MRPTTFVSQLCLLALPASVYAQSCSSSTDRSCATKMAMVPNWWPVKTSVKTTTAPVITQADGALTTVTSITTVPAVPLTATISTTVIITSTTTAKPVTNTVSSTSTVFSTVSVVTTSTRTGLVTTTLVSTVTNAQTSLIPAPTNFMDAYNSTGDSTYAGAKRNIGRRRDLATRLEHDKRGRLSNLLKSIFNAFPGLKPGGRNKPKQTLALGDFDNPVAVSCTVTVQRTCGGGSRATTVVITSTGTPTTTTSVITSTITSVTTRIPPATTVTVFSRTVTSTITQSTTVAVGATSTVTQTTTVTVNAATTTMYAACAKENLLGSRLANGNAIKRTFMYDTRAVVVTSAESSAYDCCVACQTSNQCQFFQYSGRSGTCFVTGQDENWCPNGQQDAGWPAVFVWDEPAKVDDALVIGNGPCGITMNSGQDQGSQ